MRFLADESCDGAIVRALREAGHDVTSVRDTMRGATDRSVLDAAFKEQRLLLTEDKDFGELVFARPIRPATERVFATRVARHGVRLSAPTRMLFRGGALYINGEAHRPSGSSATRLARLADHRWLPPRARFDRESLGLLYRWYRAGYVNIGGE